MVPDAQALTAAVVPGVLDDAARAAYAKAFDARRDTTGGLGDMEACLRRSQLFDVVLGGQVVARYALEQVQADKGVEVWVTALAGHLPGVDLVRGLSPYIERQCAQADCLTMQTRRPGLVKKLEREGWELSAYIMRKKL